MKSIQKIQFGVRVIRTLFLKDDFQWFVVQILRQIGDFDYDFVRKHMLVGFNNNWRIQWPFQIWSWIINPTSLCKDIEICESTSKISEFLRSSKMKINIQIVSIWTNFDIIYQNLPKFAREFENKAFLRRLNFSLIREYFLYLCIEMSDFKSRTRFEMVIKFSNYD